MIEAGLSKLLPYKNPKLKFCYYFSWQQQVPYTQVTRPLATHNL